VSDKTLKCQVLLGWISHEGKEALLNEDILNGVKTKWHLCFIV